MSFDPKGTTPGLAQPAAEEPKTINLRCRGENCTSILAIDVTPKENPAGQNIYQCVKCKRTWGIAIGGGVSF